MRAEIIKTVVILAISTLFVACSVEKSVDQQDRENVQLSPSLAVQQPVPTILPSELPIGTTAEIFENWQSAIATKEPDRSYQSVWVRMFPILSRPYRDPYSLTRDIYHITIDNPKGLTVYNLETLQEIAFGRKFEFHFDKNKMVIDGVEQNLVPIWLVPQSLNSESALVWDNKFISKVGIVLRGQFIIKSTEFLGRKSLSRQARRMHKWSRGQKVNLWSLINIVSMFDYLKAVVPAEMYSHWHEEALKVQAIAARTYALYEMIESRKVKKLEWDVSPTTWYQSYQGVFFLKKTKVAARGTYEWSNRETDKTNTAVEETLNKVIIYKGEIIKSFFHSNSGGVTCNIEECFHLKGGDQPYLIPVQDARGVKSEGGTGTWGNKAKLTRETITAVLKKLGKEIEKVDQVIAHRIGKSGRTWQMAVKFLSGNKLVLSRVESNHIRKLFGPIRSNLFTLYKPDEFGIQKVVGHGYGHGVGMSQVGAQFFAKQEFLAEDILRHYYRGTNIVSILDY